MTFSQSLNFHEIFSSCEVNQLTKDQVANMNFTSETSGSLVFDDSTLNVQFHSSSFIQRCPSVI